MKAIRKQARGPGTAHTHRPQAHWVWGPDTAGTQLGMHLSEPGPEMG